MPARREGPVQSLNGHLPPSLSIPPPAGAGSHYPLPENQRPPSQPQWYDRLVDALVGEDSPESKYALICGHCYTHNGLVLVQEMETIRKCLVGLCYC
ncbi:hypothetical protein BDF14DRAFT_1817697 [Spinellus fusiger]|nr:hypothetical protein BDF14DRAFT_1817697 [Spinellus fusiger]